MLSKKEINSIKEGDLVFISDELCICTYNGTNFKKFMWVGKGGTLDIWNMEQRTDIALLDTDESLLIVAALYEQ